MDFFALYQNHIQTANKLIAALNQSGIRSEISFAENSKMKTFSLLVYKLIFPTDALSDGLKGATFAQRIKEIYSEIEKLIN